MAEEEYNEFLDKNYDQFCDLYDEGNRLFSKNNFDEALYIFADALEIIPDPKSDWEESTAILAAIADIWFMKKNYQVCIDALKDALSGPDADKNAQLHFRLGQAYYELGEIKQATEAFYQAHILDEDLFEDESDLYFDLLIEREKPEK